MNPIRSNELNLFAQELRECLSPAVLKDIAKRVGTEELLNILHRLYQLLQKNGRKCHRSKKRTVFDILGIVYETTVKHRQAT